MRFSTRFECFLCHVVEFRRSLTQQAEPSPADEALTRILKTALMLVDVRVLDHLIVGGCVIYSMAEHGLM
ncbi:hypothetical protein ABID97_002337 [Variovorax sp. OAS795]